MEEILSEYAACNKDEEVDAGLRPVLQRRAKSYQTQAGRFQLPG